MLAIYHSWCGGVPGGPPPAPPHSLTLRHKYPQWSWLLIKVYSPSQFANTVILHFLRRVGPLSCILFPCGSWTKRYPCTLSLFSGMTVCFITREMEGFQVPPRQAALFVRLKPGRIRYTWCNFYFCFSMINRKYFPVHFSTQLGRVHKPEDT